MSDTHTFNLDGLELELPVRWETEHDDDGCGEPHKSGNAMTGCRGSRRVAYIGKLDYEVRGQIIDKIVEHVTEEMAELEEDE